VSSESLRRLDALARRYRCRPSQLTGEIDAWSAYQLDEACLLAALLHEEALADEPPRPSPPPPPQLRTFDGMPLLVGAITKAP
jgi:hypothetical protein